MHESNNVTTSLQKETLMLTQPSGLLGIADRYLDCSPYMNLERFIRQATLAAYALPDEIKEPLIEFKQQGNTDGYLLFDAFPTDSDLMETPLDGLSVKEKKSSFYSEFWLTVVGGLLGDPFSYVQENRGNIYHNVRPTMNNQDKLSSESSAILLDFHTETAFHPFMPDFLLLYCLRGDRHKEAQTITTSIRRFYHALSPELKHILRQPLFKSGIDYSFGSSNGKRGNGPVMPILYGDDEDPLITFDPDLMLGLTDEANNAITELGAIMKRYKKGVVLQQGQLIAVDNRRALHGRTYFQAYFDGRDRWLQRLYVTRDLSRASILFSKRERIISHTFDGV